MPNSFPQIVQSQALRKGKKCPMTKCSNSTSNTRVCVASGTTRSDHGSLPFLGLLEPQKGRKLFFNGYLDEESLSLADEI
jgi:hypothetical protein